MLLCYGSNASTVRQYTVSCMCMESFYTLKLSSFLFSCVLERRLHILVALSLCTFSSLFLFINAFHN